MLKEWSTLGLDELKKLYEDEAESFKASLLNGARWEDVQDQRKKVTELAIALHRKKQVDAQSMNPAENPSDDIEDRG